MCLLASKSPIFNACSLYAVFHHARPNDDPDEEVDVQIIWLTRGQCLSAPQRPGAVYSVHCVSTSDRASVDIEFEGETMGKTRSNALENLDINLESTPVLI
jgi:hypothetical protein